MKRRFLMVLAGASAVMAAGLAVAQHVSITATGGMRQAEVLVLNSAATLIPSSGWSGRRSIEIYNNGPNAIYCSGGTPVVNRAREIAPDGAWAVDVSEAIVLRCIAATADQAASAATIVTEVR